MLICHHQRIGQKSTAGMQNIYVCMYACIRNVNTHVTMKHCSLGAQIFACVLVQRLHIQVAPHRKLQLVYPVCCFASSEAVELPVPFIVVHSN